MGSGSWKRAFVGLGANLGNRLENCIKALDLLSAHPGVDVVCRSRFYETEPVGINTPRWFINAVAEIYTSLGPRDLLRNLSDIEEALGRDRSATEDRPIDLDILFMEGVLIQTSNHQITKSPNHQIHIPHPLLSARRFVLEPWVELAPDLMLRPWRKTVSELLAELPEDCPVVRELKCKGTGES